MTRKEEYESRAEALLLPILEENSFSLVDVEYVKEAGTWYLRAYIDKEGGITIDDCELVSRSFDAVLDREDFITDSYVLEVSSPGLGRPLKKDRDFERNLDREVELKLFAPRDGEKEFRGTLVRYSADDLTLRAESGKELTFGRRELALIREAFDF